MGLLLVVGEDPGPLRREGAGGASAPGPGF